LEVENMALLTLPEHISLTRNLIMLKAFIMDLLLLKQMINSTILTKMEPLYGQAMKPLHFMKYCLIKKRTNNKNIYNNIIIHL